MKRKAILTEVPADIHVQSFVGTLVVEDFDKFFEARLLLKKIGGVRLGSLLLQGQMLALMTPVLLRMDGLDIVLFTIGVAAATLNWKTAALYAVGFMAQYLLVARLRRITERVSF